MATSGDHTVAVDNHSAGRHLTTFPDAVRWAMTTVTSVGYGDRFPVTETGRIVAAGLMVCGIALLGTVTATLASWLVERVSDTERQTQVDVAELADQVRKLREDVAKLRPPASGPSRAVDE